MKTAAYVLSTISIILCLLIIGMATASGNTLAAIGWVVALIAYFLPEYLRSKAEFEELD